MIGLLNDEDTPILHQFNCVLSIAKCHIYKTQAAKCDLHHIDLLYSMIRSANIDLNKFPENVSNNSPRLENIVCLDYELPRYEWVHMTFRNVTTLHVHL